MADDLILYTHPWSRGRIARWMLEEVGVPYRAEIIAYGPPMKASAYRAINPMGKVPALVHGDVVVTEVAAICAYLADAFPDAGLAPPAGSRQRGTFYRWMFFSGCVEAATTDKAIGAVIPDEKRGMVGYGSLDLVVETLSDHLRGREYLVGDRFSAADVVLGSQIGWGMQSGSMPVRPELEAYAARIFARPASQRARQIDDDLAADMKAAREANEKA